MPWDGRVQDWVNPARQDLNWYSKSLDSVFFVTRVVDGFLTVRNT